MPDAPTATRGRGRTERISISIPPALTAELRARARDEGRSLSNLCALVLAGWVQQTSSDP